MPAQHISCDGVLTSSLPSVWELRLCRLTTLGARG